MCLVINGFLISSKCLNLSKKACLYLDLTNAREATSNKKILKRNLNFFGYELILFTQFFA
jgi:hypothetical protein